MFDRNLDLNRILILKLWVYRHWIGVWNEIVRLDLDL